MAAKRSETLETLPVYTVSYSARLLIFSNTKVRALDVKKNWGPQHVSFCPIFTVFPVPPTPTPFFFTVFVILILKWLAVLYILTSWNLRGGYYWGFQQSMIKKKLCKPV
jgi:hypothetical protein